MSEHELTGDGAAAAKTYAARLRTLFEPVRRGGATQADLARAVHWSEAAVSRYLSGDRVASKEFVHEFAACLGARGHPLSEPDLADLHARRRTAQRLSNKLVNQLLYWQEEVERLQALAHVSDADLTAAHRRLDELSSELDDARTRAKTLETERDELRDRAFDQWRQLGQASRYSRQIDEELAQERELARELRREVRVLRRQVERLRDVPVPATEETVLPPAALLPAGAARWSADEQTRTLAAGPGPSTGLRVAAAGTQFLGVGGLVALTFLGAFVLTPDATPGMDYASGTKPAETYYTCSPGSPSACSGDNGWRWELAADGSATTTFKVGASDGARDLRGRLRLDGSQDGCGRATAHWRISVSGTAVDSGDLTAKEGGGWMTRLGRALSQSHGGRAHALAGSLPSGTTAVTLTVRRTDTESCSADLRWGDAGAK